VGHHGIQAPRSSSEAVRCVRRAGRSAISPIARDELSIDAQSLKRFVSVLRPVGEPQLRRAAILKEMEPAAGKLV
jgi:hypothetical protein